MSLPPPITQPILRPDVRGRNLTFPSVDLHHGSTLQILSAIVTLIHGANFNAPQRFVKRDYDRLKSCWSIGSMSGGWNVLR